MDVLTSDDWRFIRFYRAVGDQYTNQAPFGRSDGGVSVTPRLEAWEAALRLYGYDPEEWETLVDLGRMFLPLLANPKNVPYVVQEHFGTRYATITRDGVREDGDPY